MRDPGALAIEIAQRAIEKAAFEVASIAAAMPMDSLNDNTREVCEDQAARQAFLEVVSGLIRHSVIVSDAWRSNARQVIRAAGMDPDTFEPARKATS